MKAIDIVKNWAKNNNLQIVGEPLMLKGEMKGMKEILVELTDGETSLNLGILVKNTKLVEKTAVLTGYKDLSKNKSYFTI